MLYTDELVVFCSPTPLQIQIYRNILDSSFLRQVFRGDATNHLLLIGVLRKLCNTPELLLPILEGKDNEESAARVMLGKSVDLFPKKRIPSDVGLSGTLLVGEIETRQKQ